jgi:hypothetical protein
MRAASDGVIAAIPANANIKHRGYYRSHLGTQKSARVVFQNDARQTSRSEGASVDINSVRENLRSRYRRVTMNDNFPEIDIAVQKLVPYPKKIVFILSI